MGLIQEKFDKVVEVSVGVANATVDFILASKYSPILTSFLRPESFLVGMRKLLVLHRCVALTFPVGPVPIGLTWIRWSAAYTLLEVLVCPRQIRLDFVAEHEQGLFHRTFLGLW